MNIQFFGATDTVTGSRTLVEHRGKRLLVDCGLFQGLKKNRLRNWDPLELPPLDGVVLTHAHLDHSGWVPRLIAQGYKGPVYCTPATADLLSILWPDSGRIQEEDAERANRHHYTRHKPAKPLYDEQAAHRALKSLRTIDFGEMLEIGPFEIRFQIAGHILGASSVSIRTEAGHVLFSGDVGRAGDRVMLDPEPPPVADMIVMESTYGDRLHPETSNRDILADLVRRTAARNGMVLIPSFAVGRAQAVLWELHTLMSEGAIPELDIVVDSPMASQATAAVVAHPDVVRLDAEQLEAMTRDVQFVGSVDESKAVGQRKGPFILIAASGMLTGGRVLQHLINFGMTRNNTLLFVGYQAPGTRGGRIIRGERETRVYGQDLTLSCEIAEIGGFSAHADYRGLMSWLDSAPEPPTTVLLNHGEHDASEALRRRLKDEGYNCFVATEDVRWEVRTGQRLARKDVDPFTHAALLFDTDDDETAAAVLSLVDGEGEEAPTRRIIVRGPLIERLRKLLPPSGFDKLIQE